ncbi:MAG: glycoside hydrolase family 2 protein [Lachnospiraceae bacterium]|nr:glycoside hydrolase family 2 protein [Lachnospiraceae bacterium]
MIIYLNNDWRFSRISEDTELFSDTDGNNVETVRLPHSVAVTPFNCFDESSYQMVSLYEKTVVIPEGWRGKRVRITFEGVAHEATLYLNKDKLTTHRCGYTAFTIDLTDKLLYGAPNRISVRVDSNETLNQPPFGFVIDYMTYGGIYRDVYLEVTDECSLDDVFVYSDIYFSQNKATLTAELTYSGAVAGASEPLEVATYLEEKLLGKSPVDAPEGKQALSFDLRLDDITLWDIDTPKLYTVEVRLLKQSGEILDTEEIAFGFRTATFKADGFYLNGKKIKLRGLNRHQSYPYVGYAMPESMQIMDADVLKCELGLNAVRTSHYPQSHDFIKRCDEIGLLVFTEIPGWQHIGDDEWKKTAVENTREMVAQYRNHPSIILWGVRINESPDDDLFYAATNQAAHDLDKTRATGGVRCIKKSNLLEDVYTYNDFLHDGTNAGCDKKKKVTPDMSKAYLISEYNGHMFPTKNYDTEEHRREHAIRHATVLDAVAGESDIAGSFGWCMADYNTHKDFGSGDRICYHGVLDMFRNLKPAAYIYSALCEDTPVLELSSTMDIGEHPACNRGVTWIYTNADSVRMYKNDRFIKEYRAEDSPFKNLAHGPIMVDDFIGDAIEKGESGSAAYKRDLKRALNIVAVNGLSHPSGEFMRLAAKLVLFHAMNPSKATPLYNKYVGDWGAKATEYRFEAIKDGKVVKTLIKKPVKKIFIEATSDFTELVERKTYGVAAVRIKAVDEFGNVSFFYNEPLKLTAEGAIELIGPSLISLKGGMGGTYVKTLGEGRGSLTIEAEDAESVTIEFNVTCDNTESL